MARSPRFLMIAVFLATTALPAALLSSAAVAQEEVTDAKAAELIKAADEAKARAEKAEAELKVAQAKATELQSALTKLRSQISKAEKAVKDSEAKVKPEQDKVTKADAANKPVAAAAKAARAAAEAAKKAAADAEAKAKAEEAKAVATMKALSDAQAALKAVTTAVATAKKTVTDSQAGFKTAEASVAQFKPQFDKVSEAYAAVSKEHIDKRRASEQALIKLGKLVSFAESVAPIVSRRCLACHNAKTAKGRYNMENFAGIMKGGESGAAIEIGDAESSTLFAMIEDGSMPKDADPLSPQQLAAVKKWIETGAVLDAGFATNDPLIQIMPKEVQPPAPDVYPVPIPVTAVAFNHDGSLLATSGYHEVILWKVADGSIVRRITNVAERVYDIQFTKDGQKIVIAAGTPAQIGEAKIFQISDGKLLGDLVRTDD
ncbi:MAG: hypothetical protein H8E37_01480, partial [Planctomycetes bacterium]|nr:hypothetical protein [Planctomycetota bacterium]